MERHYGTLALMMLVLSEVLCVEPDGSILNDLDEMTLRKGDIPATERSVVIKNTRRVTVEGDAISGLHSLTSITFDGIERLQIKQDGLASQNQSRLLDLNVRNVGSLLVEAGAFSGVWPQPTTIRLHHIDKVNLEANAFNYQAAESAPSISLQHVKLLNLDRGGFAAPIFRLALSNVTMDVCRGKSFGGDVLYEFGNVTMDVAEAGCFYGQNDFTTFKIQSLRTDIVQPQAFSGSLSELIIRDSRFNTIQEKGFDISVTNMELTNSYIKELHSDGLTVSASEKIQLERVSVDLLRRNGLVGLKTEKNIKGVDPTVTIRNIELLKTESGSLTFSECTKLQLADLRLAALSPRICPTERWTQALSGGGISGQLSSAQYQLFFQLWDERLCLEDRWRKMPITVDGPQCVAGNQRGSTDQRDHTSLDDLEHTAVIGQASQDDSSEDDAAESDGSHVDGRGQNVSDGDDLSPDSKVSSKVAVSTAKVRDAPGGSHTKTSSSESGKPLATKLQSEVHNSAARELANADAPIFPTNDSPLVVKKIITSVLGAEKSDSLDGMGIRRRPGVSLPLSTGDNPAPRSMGKKDFHYSRQLLWVVLGAVLMLIVLCTVLLLMRALHHNIGRRKAADIRDPMLTRLMENSEDGNSINGCHLVKAGMPGDSVRNLTSPSVEYFQYEPIKDVPW